jgi:NADPH:quinone reductase-like Zn-dependent oxidoreductase
MRAARFHSYGAADVLVVEDAPEPHSGEGSIRIKVHAASVNPIDVIRSRESCRRVRLNIRGKTVNGALPRLTVVSRNMSVIAFRSHSA